jgi:hypothetical protein
MKEKEIEMKEKEMEIIKQDYQTIYNQYSGVMNTKNYQLEISPDNSISNYRFNFSQMTNIVGIKLLNYSIPNKIFNIEDNINNIFKYNIHTLEGGEQSSSSNNNAVLSSINKLCEIKLLGGFYTIETLISALNLDQNDLVFELNNLTQQIILKSDKKFNVIKTQMSFSNLGFINTASKFENEHISSDIWDLRIDNKVYLFLTNIDKEVPFGVLFPTSTSESEFKFENNISLDFLDIVFKNGNGDEINFYNITHYLNIQITVSNN